MNKKRIFSIFCAAAIILSVTSSVSALEYGEVPSFVPPNYNPGETTTVETTDDSGNTVEVSAIRAETVTSNILTSAVTSGAVVKMDTSTAKIKVSAIKNLAKLENATLEIVTSKYSIEINSEDITTPKNLNLAMSVKNTDNLVVISTKQTGDFGLKMNVKVPTTIPAAVLAKCHVYAIVNGAVEDLGLVEVDEQGNAIIPMEKGGKYVIAVNAPSA